MLLSSDSIDDIRGLVDPTDFYDGTYRLVFEAVCSLRDRGDPADEITVPNEIRRKNPGNDPLSHVGGYAGLSEMVSNVPSVGNVMHYAGIVAEHSLRRRLIAASKNIGRIGREGENPSELFDEASEALFSVGERLHGRDDVTQVKTLIAPAFEAIEAASEAEGEVLGMPTGFADFDKLTSGLRPGNLVVIAARPSMGKSVMALNIAEHVAVKQRKPVIFYSLEMSNEELMERLFASTGRIDYNRIRSGTIIDEEWQRLSAAVGSLGDAPLYVNSGTNTTVSRMWSQCRRLYHRGGLSLIVVDYLQLMGGTRRENRVQEVSDISRGLKLLAKELSVPVVALSQLSRNCEQRPDKRPMLSDLRESGAIEQDADIVAFIYRDEVYDEGSPAKGEAELIVAKHRQGPIRTVRLSFMGQYAKFASMASAAEPSSAFPSASRPEGSPAPSDQRVAQPL